MPAFTYPFASSGPPNLSHKAGVYQNVSSPSGLLVVGGNGQNDNDPFYYYPKTDSSDASKGSNEPQDVEHGRAFTVSDPDVIWVIPGKDAGATTHYLRYNVATDTWSQPVSTLPYGDSSLLGTAAAHDGTDWYLMGGYSSAAHADVARWDVSAGSWDTSIAPLPTTKYRGIGWEYNGQPYYVGGGGTGTDVFRYDPAADSWTTLTSIPVGISQIYECHALDRANGYGYVWDQGDDTNKAYQYDFAADSWTQITSLPYKAESHQAAFYPPNGMVYVGGGYNLTSASVTDALYEYDPGADSYTQVKSVMDGGNNGSRLQGHMAYAKNAP